MFVEHKHSKSCKKMNSPSIPRAPPLLRPRLRQLAMKYFQGDQTRRGRGWIVQRVSSIPTCPVDSARCSSLFWGKGSPLNSTNRKRMPFFPDAHWASEHFKFGFEGKSSLLDICFCPGDLSKWREGVRRLNQTPLFHMGLIRVSGLEGNYPFQE